MYHASCLGGREGNRNDELRENCGVIYPPFSDLADNMTIPSMSRRGLPKVNSAPPDVWKAFDPQEGFSNQLLGTSRTGLD